MSNNHHQKNHNDKSNNCCFIPIPGPLGPQGFTGPSGASFIDFGRSCTFFTRDIYTTGCTGCTGETNDRTLDLHAEVAATPVNSFTGTPYSVFKADECPPVNPNITLVLEPMGRGAVQTTRPDGTILGGNPRGEAAIDLQILRSDPTQVASGRFSVIGGGAENIASNDFSTVSGGDGNVASALAATVAGGQAHVASALGSTIGGGIFNMATGGASTIAGGQANETDGTFSTIGGGRNNNALGECSTIPGGCENTASRSNSFASGFNAQAIHDNTFVYGGATGPTTSGAPYQAVFNLTGVTYTAPPNPGTFFINGDLFVTGDIDAFSKSFIIDHPVLEGKSLRHICVEAPKAKLIYNGTVQLTNGRADINIDITSGMTDTTFEYLTKNALVYLTNGSNWDLIKVENVDVLPTGKFTIISNNTESNAIVNWLVIAERKDIDILIEVDKPKMVDTNV